MLPHTNKNSCRETKKINIKSCKVNSNLINKQLWKMCKMNMSNITILFNLKMKINLIINILIYKQIKILKIYYNWIIIIINPNNKNILMIKIKICWFNRSKTIYKLFKMINTSMILIVRVPIIFMISLKNRANKYFKKFK